MVDKSVWAVSGVSILLLASPAIAAPEKGEVSIASSRKVVPSIDSLAPAAIETKLTEPETEPAISVRAIDSAQSPILPVPRLYGEPESLFHSSAHAPDSIALDPVPPDPLEQMTAAEWQALVNDPEVPEVNPDSETDEAVVTSDAVQAIEPDLAAPDSATPDSAATQADADAHLNRAATPMGKARSQTIAPDTSAAVPLPESEPLESIEPTIAPPSGALAQVTSVSQLSDVQPSDWSFQALQSLVERYGVIAGFPDGTFGGNRALTRYEFAAGLNAALDVIQQQLETAAAQPTRQDLETLQRLSDDFAPELAALRGRVDRLESQTAALEANQFSTTTTLNGQVVFGLAGAGGGDPPGTGVGNIVLTHLTLLQLSTSFTGRDALRVGLSAGNFRDRGFANAESLNTNMALLGYQTDSDNEIELDSLEYRFAVGDRLVLTVKPVGFSLNTVLSPNSIFSSSTTGALSRFAAFNPVYRIGSLDAGAGLDYLVSDRARVQIAFGARHANDPENGLFAADHRALGVQILARPTANLTTSFAYVNAFASDGRLDTFTGSNNADISGGINEPSTVHALSGTLQWQLSRGIVFSTWGGAIVTDSLPSNAVTLATTYLFSLGFPDPFGREGDLLGVLVGQPPRLGEGYLIEREDAGTSLHYEAFYRFRVNDNLSITPGCFLVTNPGHISENNDIFVGAIRTTFSF